MAASSPAQVLSLTTTVGSEDDARRLAQAVLEARLACVQLERIESHFRWQGALQAEAEIRLTFKSTPDRLPALQAWLAGQHPYALPQLLWALQDASPAYADWVRREVDAG